MARTVSSGVQALAGSRRAVVAHLLGFTVSSVDYFFADRTVTYGGNDYLPKLQLGEGPRLRRGLAVDTCTVGIENVSTEFAQIIRQHFLEGTPATLTRLYIGAGTLVLFAGRIATVEVDGRLARLTLRSRLDARGVDIPVRAHSALCPWTFKSPACGYVGVLETCAKTYADCTARARLISFGGFPTLTAELADTVDAPPATPQVADGQDFLSSFYEES